MKKFLENTLQLGFMQCLSQHIKCPFFNYDSYSFWRFIHQNKKPGAGKTNQKLHSCWSTEKKLIDEHFSIKNYTADG